MSVYACSDLHGCLDLYKQIKEFLQPEDKVFFLGDAGDRGKYPWDTIKAILNDEQFIYIKGNHDDMLVRVLNGYFSKGFANYYDESDLIHNGGQKTLDEALADPDVKNILTSLSALPAYKEYINKNSERVFLSHAGFTPWTADFADIALPAPKDLIWDRDHILDAVDDDWVEDVVIVHGHTPIPLMPIVPRNAELHGAYWYAENRKVCIDTGAVWTGEAVLLDLDTWDEHIFATD
jgi:calcineurin-like phosphoesterase family protein